jgi:hypothetical protein
LLEKALEASGDDLNSAIKSLNELRLESTDAILSSTGFKPENGHPAAIHASVEGSFLYPKAVIFLGCNYSAIMDIAHPFNSTFTYEFHQAKDFMWCVDFNSLFQSFQFA